MKKIKIINCFIGKARGGIEVVTRDYAESFKELGFQSEIITLKSRNYTDYLKESGLPVQFMIGRGLNPFSFLQFAILLYKSKPDIVLLHGTRSVELGTHFLIKSLFPKIKFVGVTHGVVSKKYKRLEYVFCITKGLTKELENLGIPNCYTCLNTTPACDYVTAPENTPLIIGSAGRNSPAKGFDVLIEAIAICKKRNVPCQCRIAGCDTANFQDLIHKLSLDKEVHCLGWVIDKNSFYNQLDIYCSASRIEPFGLTLIEAMMHGRPVVTTDCKGPKEIIRPDFGIMVQKNNPEALADALCQMLTKTQERLKMGQKARTMALKHFNRAHLPARLKEILQEMKIIS